jgi:hypothetical protein
MLKLLQIDRDYEEAATGNGEGPFLHRPILEIALDMARFRLEVARAG